MTLIIGSIIKLLGSAGFGTIFGGVMGWLNRKVDLQAKKMDQDHELAMRDKDAAIMDREWAGRLKVAEAEGAAASEVAAFNALGESYSFAQPEKGSRMAAFSSFVRPFVSLGYWLVTSIGSGWILYYAFAVVKITLSPEQWFELVMYVIAWVAFMAGATIGWWYAMRPGGRMPTFGK